VERDKIFLSSAVALSLLLHSCAPKSSEQTTLPVVLATPTLLSPLPTPVSTETAVHTASPTPEPTPVHNFIVNPRTGAVYQIVKNPDGTTGRCVILGKYSTSNMQDIVGAATVLGPDPYAYSDHFRFKVIRPDGTPDKTFTTNSMPSNDVFHLVPPGTIVCED